MQLQAAAGVAAAAFAEETAGICTRLHVGDRGYQEAASQVQHMGCCLWSWPVPTAASAAAVAACVPLMIRRYCV
jgi:hypothetical protein